MQIDILLGNRTGGLQLERVGTPRLVDGGFVETPIFAGWRVMHSIARTRKRVLYGLPEGVGMYKALRVAGGSAGCAR